MENFWQCAHAKCQTSPRSYSLPKQELWLLGNTLISTESTPPTGRQSLSHVEDCRNDSAPNERKFHPTVRVQQKPACWLVFALHLFSPSGVPVLKGESRVRLITVFILEVCEYTASERFRFLKYCDEAMVRCWTQLNPADRPMLNTVSCVKSFVFNVPVTLMRCSYPSVQICSATKPTTFAIPRHSLDSGWPVRENGTGMCIWHSTKLTWHQGANQCQAEYLSLGFVRKSASLFRYSTIVITLLDIYHGFWTCTMEFLVNACMHMVLIQYHVK